MTEMGLVSRSGKPFALSLFHKMLRSPTYCGLILYRGELYEGKHEPLITRELYDSVQVALRCHGFRRPPGLKSYLYRGMFRCGECGCTITVESQKGHVYLRCTKRVRSCSQPYLREESMAQQVTMLLRSLSISPEAAQDVIADLQAERRRDRTALDRQLSSIKLSIAELDASLDKLLSTYLDAAISLEEYQRAKNDLVHRKQRLNASLEESRRAGRTWFEPAIRFIEALETAYHLAEQGSDESNRDFLKQTGSNLYLKDGQLLFEPHGPWKIVVAQGRLGIGAGGAKRAAGAARAEFSASHSWCPREDVRRTLTIQVKDFFADRSLIAPG